MHWKIKAALQNTVSLLPSAISYDAYYWLQRHLGRMRKADPLPNLKAGIGLWRQIQGLGHDPAGKVFFEVGSGWAPVTPLALWLMGAGRIVTVDLNRYMKAEIVAENLRYMREHRAEIEALFGPLLDRGRFARLLALSEQPGPLLPRLLEACAIRYCAPCDAANTDLPAESVDYHLSVNTFEHIPPEALRAILKEGARIIRPEGLFLHGVDYSDHFAHTDASISYVNFLQYSDAAWDAYAGNRYMYHNRLRHDDCLGIFEAAGHDLVKVEPRIDRRSHDLLARAAIGIDGRFRDKALDVLATSSALIISRKAVH